MERFFFGVAAGGLFGLGLIISGMTDTRKVQGFLDVFGTWDPTLAFVMGGAILPMALAWRLVKRMEQKGESPVLGGTFPLPPSAKIDRRLLKGSLAFGIGWGLVGLCPGPALASLSFGGQEGILFAAALAVGMWLAIPFKQS